MTRIRYIEKQNGQEIPSLSHVGREEADEYEPDPSIQAGINNVAFAMRELYKTTATLVYLHDWEARAKEVAADLQKQREEIEALERRVKRIIANMEASK